LTKVATPEEAWRGNPGAEVERRFGKDDEVRNLERGGPGRESRVGLSAGKTLKGNLPKHMRVGRRSPGEARHPEMPAVERIPLRRAKPRRVANPILGVTADVGRRTSAGSKALKWGAR
jgi:hypothetical protein